MQQTVGTTPVLLGPENTMGEDNRVMSGFRRALIQNLGPGDLYLDYREDVSSSDGFQLVPDAEPIELPGVRPVYAVASADTDVRFIDIW